MLKQKLTNVVTLTAVSFLLVLCAQPVFAQSGCVQNSPENPSLLLGLVGGAVAAVPFLAAHIKQRFRK